VRQEVVRSLATWILNRGPLVFARSHELRFVVPTLSDAEVVRRWRLFRKRGRPITDVDMLALIGCISTLMRDVIIEIMQRCSYHDTYALYVAHAISSDLNTTSTIDIAEQRLLSWSASPATDIKISPLTMFVANTVTQTVSSWKEMNILTSDDAQPVADILNLVSTVHDQISYRSPPPSPT